MKRAAGMGLTIGASFYLAIAVFGYLAFGSALPDDILTAFDSPKWVCRQQCGGPSLSAWAVVGAGPAQRFAKGTVPLPDIFTQYLAQHARIWRTRTGFC